jgi:hypothetical protein
LQIRVCRQLAQDIRRGVDQGPGVRILPAHRDRRLGSGAPAKATPSESRAVGTIAIPLREPAPGGRPQHPELHGEKAAAALRRSPGPISSGGTRTW